MAINLKSTDGVVSGGVKLLIYGLSGAGKTYQIRHLPDPVVISAEGGLLSLSDVKLPYIEIATMDDLKEAYTWCSESDDAKRHRTVAIDSISEIAEVILATEKAKTKDPRQAYGAMQDQIAQIVRAFRDLEGRHVYMSAKAEKQQDDTGKILFSPSMPGNKAAQQLPYHFDEVLALQTHTDEEGEVKRAFLTAPSTTWLAKDRSGKLDTWEPPNIGDVINKIAAKASKNGGK